MRLFEASNGRFWPSVHRCAFTVLGPGSGRPRIWRFGARLLSLGRFTGPGLFWPSGRSLGPYMGRFGRPTVWRFGRPLLGVSSRSFDGVDSVTFWPVPAGFPWFHSGRLVPARFRQPCPLELLRRYYGGTIANKVPIAAGGLGRRSFPGTGAAGLPGAILGRRSWAASPICL